MHDHTVHRDSLIGLAPIHHDRKICLPRDHYDGSPYSTAHKMDTLRPAYLKYLGTVILSPVVPAPYNLAKTAYIGTVHRSFLFHLGANRPEFDRCHCPLHHIFAHLTKSHEKLIHKEFVSV